jgi:membrane protease YdiL (CAAX protease family)
MDLPLQTPSFVPLLQGIAVLVIALSGACGLWLVQYRTIFFNAQFAHLLTVRTRPLEPFQVVSVLGIILLFAIPSALAADQTTLNIPQSMCTLALSCMAYATFGISTCACVLALRRTTFAAAFLRTDTPWQVACLKGVLYGIATIAPVLFLSYMCTGALEWLGVDPASQDVFAWLKDPALPLSGKLIIAVTAILLAPLSEELLFRGIVFPCALKPYRSFWFSALLVGTLFAIVHFHLASFLPLIVLSIFFSAGYAQTGSLLTPILMHAVFNTVSLLFFYAEFE